MIDFANVLEPAKALHAVVAGGGLAINPVTSLYVWLAATYVAAARAAATHDHQGLTRCYAMSAVTHALIGACHQLHI